MAHRITQTTLALATALLAACSSSRPAADGTLRSSVDPAIIAPGNNTLVSGLGGVDGYGETDLVALGGPTYNCDDGFWQLDASAVFPNGINFFGTKYDSAADLFASTNGYFSFGAGSGSYTPDGISFSNLPLVAGLYTDLIFCASGVPNPGRAYWDVDTSAADPAVTLTYLNVPAYGAPDFTAQDSFQIRLHNVFSDPVNGDLVGIELRYARLDWATASSMGGRYGTGGWADGQSDGMVPTAVFGEVFESGTANVVQNGTANSSATNRTPPQPGVYYWEPFVLTLSPGTIAQSATVGTAFTDDLLVTVRDPLGALASDVEVTFSPPGAGASATLSATTVMTDAQGVARVSATAGTVAGAYQVTAFVSGSGFSNPVTFDLTNTHGPAALVAVTPGASPQTATVGGPAFANPLEVTVSDQYGNAVPGVTVSYSAPGSGPSATLTFSSVLTDASGVANVTATPSTEAGSYAVAFDVGFDSGSFALTNAAGAPEALTVSAGASGQSRVVDGPAFANALEVTVRDVYGNLVPGATVSYAAPASGAGAGLSAPSAVTDGSGVASVVATPNTVAGTYAVTADSGAASGSFTLTNVPGTATTLVVTAGASGQSAPVGGPAFANALEVTVHDAFDNAVPGATVSYTAPASGASASLSAPSTLTNASGVASVVAAPNTEMGTYLVTVDSGAASGSFTLTNAPGLPATLAVTAGASGQTRVVGGPAFANGLEVTVRDTFGNPVPGATVSFAVPASGASAGLSGPSAVTDGSGVASVVATPNTVAGTYAVTADSGAASGSFTLTNVPGAATTLAVTAGASGQSAPVGGPAFANALEVTVRDAFGNAVPGASVSYSAPASGASAILSFSSVLTDASGVASVTATPNTELGTYLVTVDSGAASDTFTLTNAPGVPAALTVTVGASGQTRGVGGPAFANALEVTVRDAYGNPVPGATVTYAAPVTGATADLSSPSAVTDASGVASVEATPNTVAGTYAVTVGSGSTSGSFTLTNAPGPAATLVVTAGASGQTRVVGGPAFANPLQVTVSDTFGNPVPGATVTYTAPGSGASATLVTSPTTTNASGVASVVATPNTVAGTYSVTVASGAASGSFTLTNAPGPAATLAVTPGASGQTATVGGPAFVNPLQVTVSDTYGNPVPGATVTYTVPVGGASASLVTSPTTTNASGVASVVATPNTVAGSYVVSVASGAASGSFTLTNAPGAAAAIAVTPGASGQSAIVGGVAFAAPLEVAVADAYGNPVPGVEVYFQRPLDGASASLATSPAVTDAGGLASVIATTNPFAGTYLVLVGTGDASAAIELTNLPGSPATLAVVAGGSQHTTVADDFPVALTLSIVDAYGNGVPGVQIDLAVPPSGATATLSVSSVATDGAGQATVIATAGTVAGGYQVVASASGLSDVTFELTNDPGAPAAIAADLLATPQTAQVGGNAFANTLAVVVTDTYGNGVPGVTVTWAAPAPERAVLSDLTAQTGAAGTAQVTATTGSLAGGYSVTASIAGGLSATFSLTNSFGAPGALLLVAGDAQHATVDAVFAVELDVRVEDVFGNPMPGVLVSFDPPASGATALLSATGLATDAAGHAVVTATAGTVAGAYQVAASAEGVTAPVAFSLVNDPGAPASVTPVALSTPQGAEVGTPFGHDLAVTVRDAHDNAVPGVEVAFAAPASGASAGLSVTSDVTNASGVATVSATANDLAGEYQVDASTDGVAAPAVFALTNLAGAPGSIAVVSGSPQQAVVDAQFGAPLEVVVRDALGNPVPGATVDFAAPATGARASLSSTSPQTGADGHTSVTATAGTVAGAYQVTASVSGAADAVQFALTNQPGAPASVVAGPSSSGQSTRVGEAFASALSVTVTDAHGNPVPGVAVVFACPASGSTCTLDAANATTSAQGVATAQATAGTLPGALSATATVTGLTPVTFALTNLVGLPGSIATVSGAAQSAGVYTAFGAPLLVVVKDTFQNVVPGASVAFTVVSTGEQGAVLSAAFALTDAAGQTSITATANGAKGAYSVSASAPGAASPAVFGLTNTAIVTELDVEVSLTVFSTVITHGGVTHVRATVGPDADGRSPGGSITLSGSRPLTPVAGQAGVTTSGGDIVGTLTDGTVEIDVTLDSWRSQTVTVTYTPDAVSELTWDAATETLSLHASGARQDHSAGGCSTGGGGSALLLPLLLLALRGVRGRRRGER